MIFFFFLMDITYTLDVNNLKKKLLCVFGTNAWSYPILSGITACTFC